MIVGERSARAERQRAWRPEWWLRGTQALVLARRQGGYGREPDTTNASRLTAQRRVFAGNPMSGDIPAHLVDTIERTASAPVVHVPLVLHSLGSIDVELNVAIARSSRGCLVSSYKGCD